MAGRVLSKANETKLRAAMAEVAAVLKLLGEEGNDSVDGPAVDNDSAETQEARRRLQEAANLGNWLEAQIHLVFTQIADGMFGEGRLTREERIGLSSAIGAALNAFNTAVGETMPQLYTREPWLEAPETADVSEAALDGDFVPLLERAVRRDGTIPLRIIEPGWGSSGYYPAAVLERDGPAVFPAKTQMFWNHQTAAEEAERPEGSLHELAAELVSDARWEPNGVKGPGLYADAKVFTPYQEAVNELAPHIGVSIRATGRAVPGEAEGRKGKIIQQITAAKSVDFVTKAGAGGRIIEMFEAARTKPRQSADTPTTEANVNEQQFQEAMTRLETQNKELAGQAARLQEALLLRDAHDLVREALRGATVPDVTKARLLEQLSANPPVTDKGELDKAAFATRIAEAVKAETDYLTQAAGYGSGRIEGMGATPANVAVDNAAVEAQMADAFTRLGLSESGVQAAVNGRSW